MPRPISPYHKPGFYAEALARDRHRDIVGGRWEETGRIQMQILRDAGLQPQHHLLDIGAGALRLGCKAVPWLEPGHYWATDKSLALMQHGHAREFADPARLPEDHLVEDEDFTLPDIPATITHAIAFAIFTHLPADHLARALPRLHARLPALHRLLFTVFLAPDAASAAHALRQPDGVVTHPDRAPYHTLAETVLAATTAAGFHARFDPVRLPRGQVLVVAEPAPAR